MKKIILLFCLFLACNAEDINNESNPIQETTNYSDPGSLDYANSKPIDISECSRKTVHKIVFEEKVYLVVEPTSCKMFIDFDTSDPPDLLNDNDLDDHERIDIDELDEIQKEFVINQVSF